MSRRLILTLAVVLTGSPALMQAQQLPELTAQRRKLVNTLLAAGVRDGGLESVSLPDGKNKSVRLVSREKLRKTLASRKDWLREETREALAAYWTSTDELSGAAVAAL